MSAAAAAPMAKGAAAIVLVVAVLLLGGFVALGALLGLTSLYAGFLLLWYFSSIDVLEPGALPPLAIGALCGTATAWLMQIAVATWGATGAVPVLGLILAALYCQLVGWLPLAVNRAYMLYLTVMAAPLMQAREDFAATCLVIAVATAYFGGLAIVARIVATRRAAAAMV